MSEFSKFNPENQNRSNYIKFVKVDFIMADIDEDEWKVNAILTHKLFCWFVSFNSTKVAFWSYFGWTDLHYLFKPKEPIFKNLVEFLDGLKLKSESYSHYFKDLNRHAEFDELDYKIDFI